MQLWLSTLALLVILAGCHPAIHHRQKDRLHQAAAQNRVLITKVTLGQSFADVQEILGAPQKREAIRMPRGTRRRGGTSSTTTAR